MTLRRRLFLAGSASASAQPRRWRLASRRSARLLFCSLLLAAGSARAQGLAQLFQKPADFDKARVPNPEGKPNPVTITAYDPVLSDQELIEVAVARTAFKWGKRGDVGIYFPRGIPDKSLGEGGKRYMLLGEGAEEYLKRGGMIRGVATVGNPVDDFGAANWAKSLALVNAAHAVKSAGKSPVFKAALTQIVKDKPKLKEAAKTFDLTNEEFVGAVTEHAKTHPDVAQAIGIMMHETMLPMAFIVNGIGNETDAGTTLYGIHKRRANDMLRPTEDKVVSGRFANLMYEWWKVALPAADKAGMQLRLFTANHSAGVYDDADWLTMLNERLQNESPELARRVMARTYSYDFGTGARKPAGVHHLAQIGARDMFGQITSTSEAMAEAKLVDAGHMLNKTLGKLSPTSKALEVKPFSVAFGLPLYNAPAGVPPAKQAKQRVQRLEAMAASLRKEAEEQARVREDLDEKSPAGDKAWPTYKMAEANLIGREAVYEAQADRALALAKVMEARQAGSEKALQKAWAKLREAKQDEKDAEAHERATISGLALWRTVGQTDMIQYKGWIHGGQGSAAQKHNEELLGEEGLKKQTRQLKRYNKAYQAQLVGFYARAKGALLAAEKIVHPETAAAEGAPNAAPAAEGAPNAAEAAAEVAPKAAAPAPKAAARTPKAGPKPAKAR